ncbi:ArsR/SmtB family transcription factor [Polaribacter dokdonensis]|uniref:Regulatory protein ArsR n=1 Tax=Polaribacter dokdonensis DSW-5 TaxID=1300348 RepID=A0A0N0CG03_9FLAO|nr:metalloregulator ArsR/SmtB family transcription factor [Polaribacter dokdonensis]KOY52654.1 Regulatory protein ArsR [Polaribacter dokdonensis DSW-5]SEE49753.1 transcriptional regulator, ArsR family [Polaribacter dokdonensis DSW-5]
MGLVKNELFNVEQNTIAQYAKVLGHPARVAILQHLFKMNSCVCGELVLEIGLAQATISQHLKELKAIGLIKGNVDGTSVCYCIDTEKWKAMKLVMSQFMNADIQNSNECC